MVSGFAYLNCLIKRTSSSWMDGTMNSVLFCLGEILSALRINSAPISKHCIIHKDFQTDIIERLILCFNPHVAFVGKKSDIGGTQLLFTSHRVLYKVEDIATCLVEYVKFWDDWEVDRYGNANLDSEKTEEGKHDDQQVGTNKTAKVGIIKEPANTEINSLLDVQIQLEIPFVLSAPLLDVLASVIPLQTTTTPIPTLLPTPPITSEALTITTTVHDPLPAVIERLSDPENKFKAWTKVDHSKAITKVMQTNVINEVKNQLPMFLPKAVFDLVTPSIESKVRDVLQEYTIDPVHHDS
ncbi:hypothetical protein Tco_0501894 [Tanacetum coccineum]